MDFARNEPAGSTRGFGDEQADLQQDDGAAAVVARGAGNAQILNADAAGVVTLPPGTELNDIRVEGRDLVIIGADGVRYIIPDGAIVIPQLVIGEVAIPPLNLAALLIGNEPQPAAGNPQSSGGNFAGPVGPLQAAFGLGDLLPYTELNFPQPEEREVIPQPIDREPHVVVVTPDQPAGATSATAQVNEAGLPARNGEPAGTNAAANSEATTGTIVFGAPDGLSSISINGIVITAVGQTIQSGNGTLTITSIQPGVIGYSYTLADNTLDTSMVDTFAVAVTDTDGDVANATLTVSVIDDAPIANNDSDRVAAGTYGPETGNVLTGANTTSGAAGADQQGADGASVTAVSGTGGTDSTFDNAGNLVVAGQYGTLTLKADGSYSYARTPGTAGGVTDVFTYTLTDNDGSSDNATLTITIEDSPASVVTLPVSGSAGTIVNESGLPARPGEAPGTASATDTESTTGAITVNAPDGIASVQVGGTTITGAGQVITLPQGTLLINSYDPVTGQITYTFTLTDNTAGDNTTVSIPVTVTDVDGDSDTKSFTITIIDDAPTAVNDSATQTAENATVTVDVLANDIPGADSVQPETVALVAGSLTGTGQLTNNGDGTFTYTPGPAETGTVTFDYTITDGDGDSSTARVTITLQADSTPTIATLGDNDVLEAGLPARSGEPEGSQAAGNGETATGTIAITTGNDTIASLVINGQNVTAGGTVTTAKGSLVVAADGNGGYTYIYTLADNTLSDPDSDSFSLTITDSDGSQASTTLVVAILDDAPSALDDAASLAAGQYGPIGGNVRANDTQGADGATVTSYSGAGAPVATGAVATGAYGTLTIAADGTFSYTRNPGSPGGVTDTFEYTITDADGDPATATLTITVPNSTTTLTLPTAGQAGTSVDEEALSIGSNPSSTAESTQGTITFTAPDGPAILTIDGQPVTAGATITGAFGTLVIGAVTATSITYTYTLNTNTSGDNTSDSFTVRVEDQDGDFSENDLVIAIVDDVPTARPDSDSVTEDGKLVASGNVITDAEANGDAGGDTPGADGVTVTAVSGPNGAGTVGATLTGDYGTLQLNADGTYTYTLDNANPTVQGLDGTESVTETFNYTITDGDGDVRSTTLIVTVNGNDDPITITGLNAAGAELVVDEDDLADGSSPNAAALTQAGSFTVTGLDGIAALTIEGADAFVGQTFTNAYGTFTITSISAPADGSSTSITVGYQFVLGDNTAHPDAAGENSIVASFDIAVTDTDGSTDTDTIEVQVIDDVPTAAPDADTVAAGTYGPVGGNVITDAEGDGGEDTAGADGVIVTAISGAGGAGAVGGTTIGQYGTLTVAADGTYSYTRNPGTPGGVTDTFNYTITDADGDESNTTLTITIDNAQPIVAGNAAVQLDDDALAGGNPGGVDDADPDTANLMGTLSGSGGDGPLTWSFTSVSGIAGFTIDLVNPGLLEINQGGKTIFTVTLDTATGAYTVTQNNPYTHPAGSDENDGPFTIGYQVKDVDGQTANGSLAINIDDDTPTAFDNSNSVSEGGSTGGNVLSDATDDIFGADGGSILSFVSAGGGASATPGNSITTALGTLTINADGSYTYVSKPNSTSADTTDTFNYTIIDGDGDTSTAQLVIDIDNVSGNVFDTDVNVNEAGLDTATTTGSNPGASSEIGSGQITVTGAAGPFTYKLVGANGNGDGTYGTLVLDANTGQYTYTLDTPFTDTVTENSANVVNGAESFAYEVYDAANNLIGSGSIAVNITDDVPNAVDEGLRTVAEDAPGTIGGNVIANDTEGADHATLTHVNVGNGEVLLTSGTNLGGGVYSFTTANGVYTFTATGAWTFNPNSGLNQTAGPVDASFTYRLTDGDGDFDRATQPIQITDGAGPANQAPVTLNLDDQLLADGRTPAATQPPSDSETIAFVPGSDAFSSIVFGSTAGLGGGLTWVKSADNLTITGSQGGRLVVTLTLEVIGNNAKVVATLNDNYLHADGLGDQNSDFGSVEVVATDIDGDKATALASLEISDDLPTLSASAPAANSLQVDETTLGTDATADFSGLFTPDYNADGAGTVGNYILGIKAEGADTGLIDTASGQKVVLHLDGNKVVGWTETSHVTVFEVTITGSTVKLDQQRAVRHGDTTSVNEQSPALAADLITLTATVTDADKDTSTATANIGGAIRFLDDGPTAVNDTNSIGEDGTTVSGNVVLGNDNTAATADDDKFGADGPASPPVTAITGFGGAGVVGGTTVGEFGTLTLNANGTYTYTVDTSKTQFLDTGDTETDTFTYQIKDGDGDPTTATLIISIIGANDGPIARADTNWTVEDAGAPITGNVLANVDHTRLVAGDFKDVADTDVDDAVMVQTPGVFVGTYGTLTLNADGTYSYQVNNANSAVQALGIGDAPLVDTFNYSAFDGTTATPSTLKISIFGANDAPTLVASTATVSDEGFPGGNQDGVGSPTDISNSTTFLTGNIQIADKDATDTFTVTLGLPTAPTVRVADGSATGAALTWALADGGKTLVGYVTSAADPSVVIKITNAGTYTVEILDPIFHPNTSVEDVVSGLVVPVTVTDDSGAANASTTLANAITVNFEDDSPTLGTFAPAANTVSNNNGSTAIGSFAYAPGGDGHGTFTITGPTIDGVIYKPLVHGLIDITNDAVSNPVQGTTLTATTADGLTTLFTMQVDVNGNYKFTLVTADAATSETLSFKSLSAGGPGFRELDDDPATPINENGRVEFTSNGSGVNANNNDFGVSNSFLDPEEFFVMEFHNPGADGDQLPGQDPEFLSEIDVIVNTLQNSGGRNGPGQSGGPNVTLRWTATNTVTGATETGTITVSNTGLAHIDPSIEFNQMKIENFDNSAVGTDGGRIQIGGVKIYKVILPQDETIEFDVSAKDADGDTTTVSHLSVFIDATPPIALDLDGDGVEFLGLGAGVSHDYGAGTVATAWVAPDDGLLARDTGSGLDLVFTDDAAGASTDLEGVRLGYDSDGDGQLTSDDADWSSFGVWSDADSDGVVDDGEFVSLNAANIKSIGLISDGQAYTAAGGDVRVLGSASFTRTDGSTGSVADAVFATEARNSQRTAEIVTTAAVAAAVVNATAAAAALPPVASDHAAQHVPATAYTRVAFEPDSGYDAPSTKALPGDDRSAGARPVNEASRHGSSDDGADANASIIEAIDRAPEPANDDAADVAIHHVAAPALFGGSGAEGVMQALLAIAPADAPATDLGGDPASLQHAMSDFAGAKLIDTIVDHFTGASGDGSGPAIAMADNDPASQILVQLVDGGMQGAFHDPMIAMADADAHALAAAQA